jgi:putative protein-disulfide isomerase
VPVRARWYTDPASSHSWAQEPALRKLMVEFAADVEITYVMGGLARDYTQGYEDAPAGIGGRRGVFEGLLFHWLDVAEQSGMPFDPRLWLENPIATTYPACMAVKAAAEQADDRGYLYLRTVREGLLCFRRKLDTTEPLVDQARSAGLDVERFRVDLASNAIVEAFASNLEEARAVPAEARERGGFKDAAQGGERLVFPTARFTGAAGEDHWVFGRRPYEEYRQAALAAGAEPAGGDPPGVLDALHRFGRMAAREVEAVCDLPGPRAEAELWRLASEWRVRPLRVLTGWLFEPA